MTGKWHSTAIGRTTFFTCFCAMCTIIRENYYCSAGLRQDPVLGPCEQGDKCSGSTKTAKSFK